MTLYYRLGANLYVNVTNLCSCDCVFCIRGGTDGVGSADSLWLEREPTIWELKESFDLISVLGYYDNGRLVEWLTDRYYEDKAEKINTHKVFSCCVLCYNKM